MFRERLYIRASTRAHLQLMKSVDVVASVTACNADFYSRQGHPRSVYVRNTWSDFGTDGMVATIPTDRNDHRRPIKIIGHVGHLRRTGSTYGLKYLLVDVLPILRQVMGNLDYEIHIIGAGEVFPSLQQWIKEDHVVMRGYVRNLDEEMRSSHMLLLLNNAGSYHAAFTRHILAWSMGLCLVAHANSKLAIPEIQHMENALLGSTPSEISQLIYLAATDTNLNTRIRQGGRATYEKYFTPHEVGRILSEEMSRLGEKI